MPRYKLTVEYDGTPYLGWQIQVKGRTIQGVLENAVFRFSGEKVRVNGSGRTDTGVHAIAQIAHLDLLREWRTDVVRDALNAYLKQADETISVLAVEIVPETFDARFSALKRHYLYRIINRRPPAPLLAKRAWHVVKPLDVEAMNDAAGALIGKHDFTTFRAALCQAKSPLKTLETLSVSRIGEDVYICTSARSYLHHQVRSMTGSLVEVGTGRWQKKDLVAALEARDRMHCGPNAPPYGLYFASVDY